MAPHQKKKKNPLPLLPFFFSSDECRVTFDLMFEMAAQLSFVFTPLLSCVETITASVSCYKYKSIFSNYYCEMFMSVVPQLLQQLHGAASMWYQSTMYHQPHQKKKRKTENLIRKWKSVSLFFPNFVNKTLLSEFL